MQLHADDVRRHHAGDRRQEGGDGGDEGAALPADLLRAARRAARQPRAALVRRARALRRGVPARDPAARRLAVTDLAHIGHAELLTPKPAESLRFFVDVLGMEIEAQDGGSVYLRGWFDYSGTA